jgi:hypothetical protein
MLSLMLSAVLSLAAAPQEAKAPPTAEEIKVAVTELTDAFTKGKAPDRVIAIQKNARVVDAKVIEVIAKGLKDSETSVLDASIEALRFMQHPDALDALQSAVAREKRLEKMPETFSKLLKAIGQHGSPRSIALLADNALSSPDYKVIEARLLGLANIRDKQSVEQLIGLMRVAGREKLQPYMATFRLALMQLTGVDQGLSQDGWMGWWNDHKKDVAIPAVAPALPKEMQQRWDYYWGREVERPRTKKRGDRGNDPEGK